MALEDIMLTSSKHNAQDIFEYLIDSAQSTKDSNENFSQGTINDENNSLETLTSSMNTMEVSKYIDTMCKNSSISDPVSVWTGSVNNDIGLTHEDVVALNQHLYLISTQSTKHSDENFSQGTINEKILFNDENNSMETLTSNTNTVEVSNYLDTVCENSSISDPGSVWNGSVNNDIGLTHEDAVAINQYMNLVSPQSMKDINENFSQGTINEKVLFNDENNSMETLTSNTNTVEVPKYIDTKYENSSISDPVSVWTGSVNNDIGLTHDDAIALNQHLYLISAQSTNDSNENFSQGTINEKILFNDNNSVETLTSSMNPVEVSNYIDTTYENSSISDPVSVWTGSVNNDIGLTHDDALAINQYLNMISPQSTKDSDENFSQGTINEKMFFDNNNSMETLTSSMNTVEVSKYIDMCQNSSISDPVSVWTGSVNNDIGLTHDDALAINQYLNMISPQSTKDSDENFSQGLINEKLLFNDENNSLETLTSSMNTVEVSQYLDTTCENSSISDPVSVWTGSVNNDIGLTHDDALAINQYLNMISPQSTKDSDENFSQGLINEKLLFNDENNSLETLTSSTNTVEVSNYIDTTCENSNISDPVSVWTGSVNNDISPIYDDAVSTNQHLYLISPQSTKDINENLSQGTNNEKVLFNDENNSLETLISSTNTVKVSNYIDTTCENSNISDPVSVWTGSVNNDISPIYDDAVSTNQHLYLISPQSTKDINENLSQGTNNQKVLFNDENNSLETLISSTNTVKVSNYIDTTCENSNISDPVSVWTGSVNNDINPIYDDAVSTNQHLYLISPQSTKDINENLSQGTNNEKVLFNDENNSLETLISSTNTVKVSNYIDTTCENSNISDPVSVWTGSVNNDVSPIYDDAVSTNQHLYLISPQSTKDINENLSQGTNNEKVLFNDENNSLETLISSTNTVKVSNYIDTTCENSSINDPVSVWTGSVNNDISSTHDDAVSINQHLYLISTQSTKDSNENFSQGTINEKILFNDENNTVETLSSSTNTVEVSNYIDTTCENSNISDPVSVWTGSVNNDISSTHDDAVSINQHLYLISTQSTKDSDENFSQGKINEKILFNDENNSHEILTSSANPVEVSKYIDTTSENSSISDPVSVWTGSVNNDISSTHDDVVSTNQHLNVISAKSTKKRKKHSSQRKINKKILFNDDNNSLETLISSTNTVKVSNYIDTTCETSSISDPVSVRTGSVNNDISPTHDDRIPSTEPLICDKSLGNETSFTQDILKQPKYNYKTSISKHTNNSVYTCNSCNFETSIKSRFTYHVHNKHFKSSYNCGQCDFVTTFKSSLVKHINAKHTKDIVFNCSYCDYETCNKMTFTRHVTAKHSRANVFNCPQCKFKSYDQSDLDAHIITKHTKPSFKCSSCSYVAHDKYHLKRHINSKHTKTEVFNCSFCKFTTYIRSSLSRHVNTKHTKINVFKCSLCDHETYNKRLFEEHVTAKHTENLSLKCSYCNYKANNKGTLKAHTNAKHTKTEVFNCSFCDYTTFIKHSLNRHMNTKHTKNNIFKCSSCDYKAYDRIVLNRHVNAKHTKANVYLCTYCNLEVYYKSALASHIKTKHPEYV